MNTAITHEARHSGDEAPPAGFADRLFRGIFANGRLAPRAAALLIALLLEALLIVALVLIGIRAGDEEAAGEALTTFAARNFEPASEPAVEPEAPAQADAPPEPAPTTPPPREQPTLPDPAPIPVPSPLQLPSARPSPAQPKPQPPAAPPAEPTTPVGPPARVYGPPNNGPPSRGNDSERVGTAPNGEPLYKARWYREPTSGELSGYLSTATGPGSALIACRTVPDFYVEDCELLSEVPSGSRIGRAVLAAAWQFRVRPARIGGVSQVGSWVRIRIDYTSAIRR